MNVRWLLDFRLDIQKDGEIYALRVFEIVFSHSLLEFRTVSYDNTPSRSHVRVEWFSVDRLNGPQHHGCRTGQGCPYAGCVRQVPTTRSVAAARR